MSKLTKAIEDGLRDSLRELLSSAAEQQAGPPNNWTATTLEAIAREVREIERKLNTAPVDGGAR